MPFLSAADRAALGAPRGYQSPFGDGRLASTTATNLAMLESVHGHLEVAESPLRVLDLGCHSGALLRAIARLYEEKGWPADDYLLGADINDRNFQGGLPFQQIDLRQPLDLQGRTFDLIIAQEVLEHIRRVYPLLEELRAALRPGGRLLLSVPNMMNMRSRIRFLCSGRFHSFSGLDIDHTDRDNGEGHINPFPVQFWDYGLRCAGFSEIRYKADRLKRSSLAWSLLFAPVLGLGAWSLHRQERRNGDRVYRQNLRAMKEINTLRNLAGHGLIAECRAPVAQQKTAMDSSG